MCWNLSDCSQNNNLEQFKTLKYPREREGWVTQVMWAAVSGAGDTNSDRQRRLYHQLQ